MPREDTEEAEKSTTKATSTAGPLLLTLAVDQKEAERLVLGLNTGSLYLGLLTDSVDVKPGTGVENTDKAGGVASIFQ